MNDGNLLVFGCAVFLISVSGAYVYVRESFTSNQEPRQIELEEVAVVIEEVAVQPGLEVHT